MTVILGVAHELTPSPILLMNSGSSLRQHTWWRSPAVDGSNDRGGPVDIDYPDAEHPASNVGSFARSAQDQSY
jgi:hypothetical protein